MFEIDSLCNYVTYSHDMYDFSIRFNYLLIKIEAYFEQSILDKNHLPFFSNNLIDNLNNKINRVISIINHKVDFGEVELPENIFLLIIADDFPEYFKNYCYQTKYINN
jgi:hypothetical protein